MRLYNLLRRAFKSSLRTIVNLNLEAIGTVVVLLVVVVILVATVASIVGACNAAEARATATEACIDQAVRTFPDGDMVALTCNVDLDRVQVSLAKQLKKPLPKETSKHLLEMKDELRGRGL